MVFQPEQSDVEGSTGFISRVSAVQVRPPLLPHQICHTPAEEYHGWPEVSCSQLKALRESPLAFYWRFIAKQHAGPKSDSLAYGTLLHTWAELGPDEFWPKVVVAPDSLVTATGAFSAKAKDWLANIEPGLIPVSPADKEKLTAQTDALLANKQVRKIVEARVDAEFNIRTTWNGHAIRCRVDGATPEYFYDWKTTRDFAPQREWWRSVMQFGYHLQSAMYQHCALQCGWPPHRMRFIVTSTVWPHECGVYVLPEALIAKGERECLRLLEELRQRLDWNVWHSVDSDEASELPVPSYVLRGE